MGLEAEVGEKLEPVQLNSQEKGNDVIHLNISEESKERTKGLWRMVKPWTWLALLLSMILNLTLLVLIIRLAGRRSEPCPVFPNCSVASCPEGWIGFRGKCYYFSEVEQSWNYSQAYCAAHGASLASIDSMQEKGFLDRYKGPNDHWIGLFWDPNESWKWVNGTKLNSWFNVRGAGECAFMSYNDIASSSGSAEIHWICSKPAGDDKGKANNRT